MSSKALEGRKLLQTEQGTSPWIDEMQLAETVLVSKSEYNELPETAPRKMYSCQKRSSFALYWFDIFCTVDSSESLMLPD